MAAETNTAPGRGGGSSCTALPCAASLLGDVALTTVAGTGMDGATFAVGENIFGPFEAGFGAQQDFILKELGCTDANVASAYVEGGVDTSTAEQIVAKACGVTLPRTESSECALCSFLRSFLFIFIFIFIFFCSPANLIFFLPLLIPRLLYFHFFSSPPQALTYR